MNNDREIEYTLEVDLFGEGDIPDIPFEELEINSQLSPYLYEEERFVRHKIDTDRYSFAFFEMEGDNKDFYSNSLILAQWMLLHKDLFLPSDRFTWTVASYASSEYAAAPYRLSSDFIKIINQLNFGFEYCVYPDDMFHCKYINRNSYAVLSIPKNESRKSKENSQEEIDLPLVIKDYIDKEGYVVLSAHPMNNSDSYQNDEALIFDWYDYFSDMIDYYWKNGISRSGLTLRIDHFFGYMKSLSILFETDLLKKIGELDLNLEISLHVPGDESNYVPVEYTKDEVNYQDGFEEQKHIQAHKDQYLADKKNQSDE